MIQIFQKFSTNLSELKAKCLEIFAHFGLLDQLLSQLLLFDIDN